MEKIILTDWAQFKNIVLSRGLSPRWFLLDKFNIYAEDKIFLYSIVLEDDNDISDFEFNYKNKWNARLEYRDSTGLATIHSSPRPIESITYFSGSGDNGGVGNGNRMLFNLLATDTSKTVDLTYNEEIYIKDGVIIFENAPLGSSLSVQVVHPVDGVVTNYAKNIPLLGTGRIDINSEDAGLIPLGLTVRVIVSNSDGTGDQDDAAAFKVCGLLEMYRVNTV